MKREGNWVKRAFAKTSGTVTGDRRIADRWVPKNDPRNNCGRHFGSVPFSFPQWRMEMVPLGGVTFRVQNFLILLHKSLFLPHFSAYMKNMFSLRSSSYDLRGNYILSFSKPNTANYGLNSFSYFSAVECTARLFSY